jgi:hypothetical protein
MPNTDQTATLDAEATAALMVRALNEVNPARQIIDNLAGALEACLELNGRLDWSAEQAADRAIRAAREFLEAGDGV